MKGLRLARSYFHAHGLPLIEGEFPAYRGRIAAGLIGDGSDCLGFDDEHSRDHDWGPGFCLWLGAEDYTAIGAPLRRAYERLPASYAGFERRTSVWGGGRVGVFEIGEFYRAFIGRPDTPVTLREWLGISAAGLAACTAGEVFHDPLGRFSLIQQALRAFYPEDVRLVKIAARCMSAAQQGQYNAVRCTARAEPFAARYAETKFCADVMSIAHLLNRRYPPYYKWLHRSLRELPVLGPQLHAQVVALLGADAHHDRQRLIEEICAAVIYALRAQGLSESASELLLDHGPAVHARIRDPVLRRRNVWLG